MHDLLAGTRCYAALGLALTLPAGVEAADNLIFVEGYESGIPTCGNHLVEAPEKCDGNCACSEAFTCFGSSGSADTCDVTCHVAAQQCQNGDDCCPFVAGSGGAQCAAASDPECLGAPGWRYAQMPTANTTSQECATIANYAAQAGGSYLWTTCTPPGVSPSPGDPKITSVTDSLGHTYSVGNDDCDDAAALPQLAGWTCNNSQGQPRMACASPSPGGFRVPAGGNVIMYVTFCRFDAASGGAWPVYLWYNASQVPNPG